MRAHLLDFCLVALVVFLEFKGYFPTGPYHTLVKYFGGGGSGDVTVKAPTEAPLAKVNRKEPAVKSPKEAKMSASVKQIITDFITTNKIAVFR